MRRTSAVILALMLAPLVFGGARKPARVVRVSSRYCRRSIDAFSDGTVLVTVNGRTVKTHLSKAGVAGVRHVLRSEPHDLFWQGASFGFLELVVTTRREGRVLGAPVYLPCPNMSRFDAALERPDNTRYGKALLAALAQPRLFDGCDCPSAN
jgi:hypothetical protein